MARKHKKSSYQRLRKVQLACYFEPEQAAALRALSARTKIPAQVLVREGVDLMLAKYAEEK
jgi:Ribbon-helix-helix domain